MVVFTVLSTLVTVLAALVAIYYAREAVIQTRSSQREAHEWRIEDLDARQHAEREAALAQAEHLAELGRIKEETARSHAEEMSQRQKALSAERRVQRLIALDGVAESLIALAQVAWAEAENPPPPSEFALPATRLHFMRRRLGASAAVYSALGGDPLDSVRIIIELQYAGGDPPNRFIGLVSDALREVENIANRTPAVEG